MALLGSRAMMPPIRKRVLGLGGGAAAQAAAWAARLPTLSDQVLEIAVPVGQAGELASVEQMVAGHVHGSACPLRTADIFVDEVEHRQQLGLLAHIENKVGKQAARIGAGALAILATCTGWRIAVVERPIAIGVIPERVPLADDVPRHEPAGS